MESKMTNAGAAYRNEDEEEGVAEGAASLGPDGGPAAGKGGDLTPVSRGADEFEEDESWLEELSDEELSSLQCSGEFYKGQLKDVLGY